MIGVIIVENCWHLNSNFLTRIEVKNSDYIQYWFCSRFWDRHNPNWFFFFENLHLIGYETLQFIYNILNVRAILYIVYSKRTDINIYNIRV